MDALIKVEDATLATIGAEDQFRRHHDEIVRALMEQESGVRDGGDVVLTLKIAIAKSQDGVVYQCASALKAPGYTQSGVRGHMTRTSDGTRLRVLGKSVQAMIPGILDDAPRGDDSPFADGGEQ